MVRTQMEHRPRKRRFGTLLTTALVALAVAMAGCAGLGGAKEKGEANNSPQAVLKTSKNVAWTDETMSFDGSDSTDSDGNVAQWIFDFGDGSAPYTAKREQDAHPDHQYMEGGEYTVTLTVIDDGGDNSGAKSDLGTRQVAINQRVMIPSAPVASSPTGTQNSTTKVPFDVNDDADRAQVDLTVRSLSPTGSSSIEVRLLDSNNNEIQSEEKTVEAGATETIQLADDTLQGEDTGVYHVEVIANSGAANVEGDVEIFYDRGYIA